MQSLSFAKVVEKLNEMLKNKNPQKKMDVKKPKTGQKQDQQNLFNLNQLANAITGSDKMQHLKALKDPRHPLPGVTFDNVINHGYVVYNEIFNVPIKSANFKNDTCYIFFNWTSDPNRAITNTI